MPDMSTSIGDAPTVVPTRRPRFRTFVRAALLLGLLLGLVAAVALSLLDGDWLKHQFRQKASASLNADLTIDSVVFSKWKGHAVLSGIKLQRQTPDDTTSFTCHTAEIDVALLPLIFRSVHVKRLELTAPDVVVTAHRGAEEEPSTTVDKLKKWVSSRNLSGPRRRPHPTAPRTDWRVDRVLVHNGRFDYTLARADRPPFRAVAFGLEYAARDVSVTSMSNLLVGADVTAEIDMGGRARLVKRAGEPGTFSLTDVDLGYADRLLNQADALVVAGGILDLTATSGGNRPFRFDAKISNLRLAANPDAKSREFLLVPVDSLIDRAKAHGNSMTLTFDLGAAQLLSDDLAFVVDNAVTGLLAELAKELVKRHPTTAPTTR
jgi:uncharacterized protein involved in outer membrane biogenesis